MYHISDKWQCVAQGGSGWHSQEAVCQWFLAVILHPSDKACPLEPATVVPFIIAIRPPADFCWHQPTARCLFSYSKGFELPEKHLPRPGNGSPSEVGEPDENRRLGITGGGLGVKPLNSK
ncbi:hypothetical protein [Bacteroides fragilis]|uniref:hypothetical protein n=1 Tax=Bacteroides fragilis TaxID=817 RepID=UPI00356394C6